MATKRTTKPMTPAQREAFYEKKNTEANQAMNERDEAIAREFGAVLERLLNGEHDAVFRTPWMTQMQGGHSFGFDVKGEKFKDNPLGGELNNILLAIQAWKREMTDESYRPDLGMLVATGGFLKTSKAKCASLKASKPTPRCFVPTFAHSGCYPTAASGSARRMVASGAAPPRPKKKA